MNNQHQLKSSFLFFFVLVIGLLLQSRSLPAQSTGENHINCFTYHRFGEQKYPSTNIDTELFEQHLKFLHENDYTVLTFGEALDKLKSSDKVPEKTVVLTVDDGYKSFKTDAVPLLEKYGFSATVFLCTQYVGKSGYLSWDDIRALQDKGYEFGNHSHSHDHFLNYSDERTREEFKKDLAQAEQIFQRELGYKPDFYCYPYGEYNPDIQNILRENGYQAGAAQKSGVIRTGSDVYALPRFPMNSNYGEISKFRSKARMKALPVIEKEPENPEIKNTNPPQLTLQIDPDKINTNHIQCFVNGRKICTVSRQNNSRFTLTVQSTEKLQTRRTLYTITAPSKSGSEWHWYSHLWVNTQYGE
ncbi:MAG: polysaccharide deacetylase family protein [Bacteroidales bacterium]